MGKDNNPYAFERPEAINGRRLDGDGAGKTGYLSVDRPLCVPAALRDTKSKQPNRLIAATKTLFKGRS